MGTGGYSIVKSWEMKKLHDQQKQQAQARVCKTCFFVEILHVKKISHKLIFFTAFLRLIFFTAFEKNKKKIEFLLDHECP